MGTKRYRVLNPKEIPQEDADGNPAPARIMRFCGQHAEPCDDVGTEYFPGDVFTPPAIMRLERLLAGGYIEQVVGHG